MIKVIFLFVTSFILINASGQTIDSLSEVALLHKMNEASFGNMQGKALPRFTARDLKGKSYSLNSLKSAKVTFINLWFISCPPCIAEIPNLNRLYESMKDSTEFQFFAITRESELSVKEAIHKYGIRFPVLLTSDSTSFKLTFGNGYPANMVLNSNGEIQFILSGGSLKPTPNWEFYFKREILKILNSK